MNELRLVVFDVDGTLVDSQADILSAMSIAFEKAELEVPSRDDVLAIVGLSLNVAMPRLAPDQVSEVHHLLEDAYKRAYMLLRAERGVEQSSPLYPGARDELERLNSEAEILLGVATGKSRRGLDKLLEGHGLEHLFVTQQVADFHPSKPHPSMLRAAMDETGVSSASAVMIGDTSFDIEMARAAGMRAIGVDWGYHPTEALAEADFVIESFGELPEALEQIWGS